MSDGVRKANDFKKVSYGLGKVSNGLGKESDGVGKVLDHLRKVSDGVVGLIKVSDGHGKA